MGLEINKIIKADKSPWVEVKINGTKWIPALEELGRIMQLIGDCEDERYKHGQGRMMPARYIFRATADKNCNIKELTYQIFQTKSSFNRKHQLRLRL